ncbi:hypothetical protein Tco_0606857 [Tanacetum coccineum]
MQLEPEVKAFQRWDDNHKIRIGSLVSYLVMASMVKTKENARFSLKLRKMIANHPDQDKLKSKKVKLEALGYHKWDDGLLVVDWEDEDTGKDAYDLSWRNKVGILFCGRSVLVKSIMKRGENLLLNRNEEIRFATKCGLLHLLQIPLLAQTAIVRRYVNYIKVSDLL